MKRLELIRTKCQEAIDDYLEYGTVADREKNPLEYGRYELAQEVLEILNGENE